MKLQYHDPTFSRCTIIVLEATAVHTFIQWFQKERCAWVVQAASSAVARGSPHDSGLKGHGLFDEMRAPGSLRAFTKSVIWSSIAISPEHQVDGFSILFTLHTPVDRLCMHKEMQMTGRPEFTPR